MSTAQQSLVTVTVAGRALGKFASRSGGESTAEPQKDYPGGMAKANVYPTLPNVGDVVVSRVRANTAADRDLVAWLRLLALPERLAACEPKALRYRLLHVPARITRGGRRRRLRFPKTWPWVKDIVAVFARITAIPRPA